MIITLQLVLILCLAFIVYQDHKERLVLWYLFPIAALLFSILHILEVGFQNFAVNSGVNLIFIAIILGVLVGFSKLRSGSFNIFSGIGLGDVLFFVALSFSFATLAFVTLLVCGLIFSLVLHALLSHLTVRKAGKHNQKYTTVPLAGHLSLFFGVIMIAHSLGLYNSLYIL